MGAVLTRTCELFSNFRGIDELVAHGEKIEMTRSSSAFERSPVPMARAHRPTRVLFGVLSELDPEIGTGWRSAVDSNSQATSEALGKTQDSPS
jgi:hypothetical protein